MVAKFPCVMYPLFVYRTRFSEPRYERFTASPAEAYGDPAGHRTQLDDHQEEEDTVDPHHIGSHALEHHHIGYAGGYRSL